MAGMGTGTSRLRCWSFIDSDKLSSPSRCRRLLARRSETPPGGAWIRPATWTGLLMMMVPQSQAPASFVACGIV
jgi:hypothetical protein